MPRADAGVRLLDRAQHRQVPDARMPTRWYTEHVQHRGARRVAVRTQRRGQRGHRRACRPRCCRRRGRRRARGGPTSSTWRGRSTRSGPLFVSRRCDQSRAGSSPESRTVGKYWPWGGFDGAVLREVARGPAASRGGLTGARGRRPCRAGCRRPQCRRTTRRQLHVSSPAGRAPWSRREGSETDRRSLEMIRQLRATGESN